MSTSIRLMPRDFDLLRSLSDYRFLSPVQAGALHFDSPVLAARRLMQLARADLATQVFMPVRPFDRRVSSIFALGKKGAEQLAARGDGTPPPYLTAKEKRGNLFLDHTLRRNDLHIALTLLHRRAKGFALTTWRQAPEEVRGHAILRTRDGPTRIPCVPDGYFAVEVGGERYGFPVEIDMGTVAIQKMYLRFRAYYRWWKTGGMAQRFGTLPLRVLTLSTTPARLARLRNAAIAASPTRNGSGLFWFGRLDLADLDQPERLLGPAWTVARRGEAQLRSLFNN